MQKLILCALLISSVLVKAQTNAYLSLSKLDIDSMETFINKSNFSGNIRFYNGNDLMLDISKGYSNNEQKVLNNPSIRFNIGSIGKSLTAILLMQLVEEKVIELDNPANNYLPTQYQLTHNKTVTVRQLLNMTSALGDYFDSPNYSDSISTINGLMNLILNMKPLNDTSGVRFSYSNSGFIVIGKILEYHYKKEYRQILNERILKPAGINLTQNNSLATGYSLQDSTWVIGKDNNKNNWSAAGGLYLTIAELHLIMQSLNEEKYLTKNTINQMWRKESHPENDPPFINYGLGWMVEAPGGVKLRGHNGGVRGFQSVFRYLPDANIYIYVYSNHENGAEEIFMKELFFLLGKKGIRFNRQ